MQVLLSYIYMNNCSYKTSIHFREVCISGRKKENDFCSLDEDTLLDLAELFKIFGDSSRIKILFVLLRSEMSVNDLTNAVGMTQSAVSHQLRILKANHLVKFRRDGKSMIYSLTDEHVTAILNQGIEHISE